MGELSKQGRDDAVDALRNAAADVLSAAGDAAFRLSDIAKVVELGHDAMANGAGLELDTVLARVVSAVGRAALALTALRGGAGGEPLPDGPHVFDYDRLTNGHRWRVLRGGEVVSRGWAPTRGEAEEAARGAWEAGGE